MRRAAAAAVAVLALALAGCASTSDSPAPASPAACYTALRAQHEPGTARLIGKPGTPGACAGLSTDEISSLALRAIQDSLDAG